MMQRIRRFWPLGLIVSFSFLVALPVSAALYAPGQTLDPACAPTDVNCGVSIGISSSTASSIPYYASNGSALSATSSLMILQNGSVSIGKLVLGTPLAISSGGIGTSTAPGLNQLLLSDGNGQWEYVATSSLGFEMPLTFMYPFVRNGNTLTLTFGTTTANSWSGLQQFTGGASTTQLVISSLGTPAGTLLAADPNGNIVATSTSSLISSLTQTPTQLSFGDSISHGNGATSYSNGYTYWIAKSSGYLVSNVAVPGATSQSTDPVLFATALPVGSKNVITYTIGTNNARGGGASTDLEQDYGLNIEAQYAWLAIPLSNKLLFGSGPVSYTGSWLASTLLGVSSPGEKCVGTSCAATFSLTGSTLYIVTGAKNSNAASATLTCDGNATGATLYLTGVNGTSLPASSQFITRVSGLSNTTHSCTIQSTSSTGEINLEWAAGMNGTLPANAPVVLAGGIPDEYPVNANDAAYRTYQTAAVTELNGDGLTNIYYVNTTGVLGALNYADGSVHPNDYGHYLLAQPFISVLNTALGKNYVEPPFTSQAVSNLAQYGTENFGVGAYSLISTSLSGTDNTGVGYEALTANTTGNYNTAVGDMAMLTNTTGGWNTAMGLWALQKNVSGNYNTAIGEGTLLANTVDNNTALGYQALTLNATGTANVATGGFALAANTGGIENVATGYQALAGNTLGNYNTATGYQSLFANTTGAFNTSIGLWSLKSNTVGSYNVALGEGALLSGTGNSQNTAIGYQALTNNNSGTNEVALGYEAMHGVVTGGSNVAIGQTALFANTGGQSGVAVGALSLLNNTTGNYNSGFGEGTLQANTTGFGNTAIGQTALSGNITGSSIVALGQAAGVTLTSANQNTAGFNDTWLGAYSGPGTTTQLSNSTAIGYNALNTASNQVVLGNTSIVQTLLNGSVGIGSSSPYADLSIQNNYGSTNTVVFAIGSSTASATTTLFSISNAGDVTINGSSGGTCTIGNGVGGTSCTSDERLKTNITEIPDALAKIEQLRGVTFNWIDPTKDQSQFIGVIAQDVQSVFPQAVSTTTDGYLSVDYAALVAPLIEAVKQVAATLDGYKDSFTTKKVTTDKLCLNDVCITKAQLQVLLQESNQQSVPAADPVSDAATSTATDTESTTTEPIDTSGENGDTDATTTVPDDSTVTDTPSDTPPTPDDGSTTTQDTN